MRILEGKSQWVLTYHVKIFGPNFSKFIQRQDYVMLNLLRFFVKRCLHKQIPRKWRHKVYEHTRLQCLKFYLRFNQKLFVFTKNPKFLVKDFLQLPPSKSNVEKFPESMQTIISGGRRRPSRIDLMFNDLKDELIENMNYWNMV